MAGDGLPLPLPPDDLSVSVSFDDAGGMLAVDRVATPEVARGAVSGMDDALLPEPMDTTGPVGDFEPMGAAAEQGMLPLPELLTPMSRMSLAVAGGADDAAGAGEPLLATPGGGALPQTPKFLSPGLGLSLSAPSTGGELGVAGAAEGGAAGGRAGGIRKRKAVVTIDDTTMIPSEEMSRQLKDPSGIVRDMMTAPPSKRAMQRRQREIDGLDAQLAAPAFCDSLAPELRTLFSRVMPSKGKPFGSLPEAPEEDMLLPSAMPPPPPPHDDEAARRESLDMMPGGFGGMDESMISEQPSLVEAPMPPAPAADEGFGPFGGEDQLPPAVPEAAETGAGAGAGEAPASVEQWSDRTKRMLKYLRNWMGPESQSGSYRQMVDGKTRRTVAGTFFELLVLRTHNFVGLQQDEPYGDITITKAEHFDDHVALP